MKELLRDKYKGGKVERYEFLRVLAIHFVLYKYLDQGVNSNSNSTYDFL